MGSEKAGNLTHFFLLTADERVRNEVGGRIQLRPSIIENRKLCFIQNGITVIPTGIYNIIFGDEPLDLVIGLVEGGLEDLGM